MTLPSNSDTHRQKYCAMTSHKDCSVTPCTHAATVRDWAVLLPASIDLADVVKHEVFDQILGKRVLWREPDGALSCRVIGETSAEFLNCPTRWVEAQVFLRGGEVNQRASLVFQGGHAVADRFLNVRHKRSNEITYSLKLVPESRIDTVEVFVDRRELVSPPFPRTLIGPPPSPSCDRQSKCHPLVSYLPLGHAMRLGTRNPSNWLPGAEQAANGVAAALSK